MDEETSSDRRTIRETITQLDAADRSAFHEGMITSGTETTEADIDEELYS